MNFVIADHLKKDNRIPKKNSVGPDLSRPRLHRTGPAQISAGARADRIGQGGPASQWPKEAEAVRRTVGRPI
jgi:hypothetical protein